MNWNEYFILLASGVSLKSKDRSTKCGAIITDEQHGFRSSGFNGFPRGIDDTNEEYHKRPLKYKITEHAERNAIYQAARTGVPLDGCTMYLAHNPVHGICTDCARAIIQSGIKMVIGPGNDFPGKGDEWAKDCRRADYLLKDAGVTVFTDSTIRLPTIGND